MCMCDLMLHVLTHYFNAMHMRNIITWLLKAIADFHCMNLAVPMQWKWNGPSWPL